MSDDRSENDETGSRMDDMDGIDDDDEHHDDAKQKKVKRKKN